MNLALSEKYRIKKVVRSKGFRELLDRYSLVREYKQDPTSTCTGCCTKRGKYLYAMRDIEDYLVAQMERVNA